MNACEPSRRVSRAVLSLRVGFIAFLLLFAPQIASAEWGRESFSRGHDLDMVVDGRWAGGANGGYYPIRIRLTNHSRNARSLMFRIENLVSGSPGQIPTVERRVSIDGNATLKFTLSVPLVSRATNGGLRITENNALLELLNTPVGLPEPAESDPRPALLVITPPGGKRVDLQSFEQAVTLTLRNSEMAGRFTGGIRTDDHAVVSSQLLPENWTDYTAVDVVALSLQTLEDLSPTARSAILKWTETGGTLLVSHVGRPADKSADLSRLLELSDRRAISDWKRADLKTRLTIQQLRQRLFNANEWVGPADPDENLIAEGLESDSNWKREAEAFMRRDLLLGRVYAFQDDAFQGTTRDWAWFMLSWPNSEWQWTARYGTSSRRPHDEFLRFLIPGVGDVPVTAFLTLISLFTILIGPVNYILLHRRRQLYLLVASIPILAFVTTCALFGWAAVADGFGTRSRLRSVTIVDQGRNTAVSFNRLSLFAGLTPSAGLSFSPETAVFPVWNGLNPDGLESGTVDWTQTQQFSNGFIRSRQHAQFTTVTHRAERGRLEITRRADGASPEVSNGFEWAFEMLLVKDEAGRLYFAKNLPAGESVRLQPAQPDDLQRVREWLEKRSPKLPEQIFASGVGDPSVGPSGRRTPRPVSYTYGMQDSAPVENISFDRSLLERNLRRSNAAIENPPSATPDPMTTFPNQTYYGVLRENPGIELGVTHPTPSDDVHVVIGWY